MDKERYPRESIDSQVTTPFLKGKQSHQRRQRIFHISSLCWILNALIFVGNIILFFRIQSCQDRSPGTGDADYDPLKNILKSGTRSWNLTFGEQSRYTKPPGPEVDAAWDEITAPPGKVGFVKVQKRELDKMNLTSIAFADGSGYLATVDVFHQLHCLNMLRMEIGKKGKPREKKEVWNDHIAHCIDSLRLSLQCSSDISLLTFKWLKHSPQPWPDFRSHHTCRNWENILDWGKANMVDTKKPDLFFHPVFGSISQNFSIRDDSPGSDKSAYIESS